MSAYESLSETQQFACRVIADHARATAFAISDGILPGNEGRNYVLRKIMRRAIYHGREHLGLKDAFFYKVCDLVVQNFSGAFPELETQRDFIGKMVRLEEDRFGNTLSVGLKKLEELIKSDGIQMERGFIDFTKLASLYDSFGVPSDLIRVILEQNDFGFWETEEEFNMPFDFHHRELQYPKVRSDAEVASIARSLGGFYGGLANETGRNQFLGYETTTVEGCRVIAIFKDEERLEELSQGEKGSVILDQTPFYAESGGQVGDVGILVRTTRGSGWLNSDGSNSLESVSTVNTQIQPPATAGGSDLRATIADTYSPVAGLINSDGSNSLESVSTVNTQIQPPATAGGSDLRATVADTYSPVAGLIIHKVKIDKGSIKVGDVVNAIVDVEKRDATRRNHTATHLVHAALKEVLGTHVKQAGSVVAPNYLRFDFTHYQPISSEEIKEVEDLVNRYILQNHTVTTNMMSIEDAMRTGAVAMFGEKYGSEVRVLSVGDGKFSMELCGGTHVRATGDIGSFKITSDEAIASGVRRIRAITGFDSFERFREDELLIGRSLDVLKTQRDQLPNAIEKLQDELKRTRREMDDLKLKIATGAIGGASSNGDEAREVSGIKVVGKIVEGLDANGMRQLSDTLLARLKSGVVVLGRKDEGKAGIIVRVSDDLKDKVKAGNVIKEIVPILGGKGGGRPDMAEGGGPETEKLGEAVEASYKVIETFLTG